VQVRGFVPHFCRQLWSDSQSPPLLARLFRDCGRLQIQKDALSNNGKLVLSHHADETGMKILMKPHILFFQAK
jgi:hypothetical protein